ncbi:hypothetical protein EAG_08408 [Camponotus floridanus]|uniref:Uncharacterized protein n=1 Tax=Camponotus floridanus TaxID=104421 RepID=E1ZYS1_CAMFO|nr:hypothetical protein EAG_08408 [Camponotus floridanus]
MTTQSAEIFLPHSLSNSIQELMSASNDEILDLITTKHCPQIKERNYELEFNSKSNYLQPTEWLSCHVVLSTRRHGPGAFVSQEAPSTIVSPNLTAATAFLNPPPPPLSAPPRSATAPTARGGKGADNTGASIYQRLQQTHQSTTHATMDNFKEIPLNNVIGNISRVRLWFRPLIVLTAKPWTIGNFAFQGTHVNHANQEVFLLHISQEGIHCWPLNDNVNNGDKRALVRNLSSPVYLLYVTFLKPSLRNGSLTQKRNSLPLIDDLVTTASLATTSRSVEPRYRHLVHPFVSHGSPDLRLSPPRARRDLSEGIGVEERNAREQVRRRQWIQSVRRKAQWLFVDGRARYSAC